MKNLLTFLSLILLFGSLISCKESEEDRRRKTVELMSTQNLGLAYLEEMKLDEAEQEFLKYIELSPEDKAGYANLGLVYLRMGNYVEAEKELETARSLDEKDPDVNLLLATVYKVQGERLKSIQLLEKALEWAPDNPKILFDLCELYSTDSSTEGVEKRLAYLIHLTENTPGNLVPMVQLIETFIRTGQSDKALEVLEKLPAQFPEFPKESITYYDQTMIEIQSGALDKALRSFTVFHNYQKVTYPYQSGMTKLKGPSEASLGVPLISYSQQTAGGPEAGGSILDFIKFTEVSASAGISISSLRPEQIPKGLFPVHQTVADFDGDGDADIYVGLYDPETQSFKPYLFQNELGRYQNVTEFFGIEHQGIEQFALFADHDNNGFLDLFILQDQGALMYTNAEKGRFVNTTGDAGLDNAIGKKSVFVDLDQDGDLDIFLIGQGLNQVYRNNGDGSFTELAEKMNLQGQKGSFINDLVFGDFDDDGDLDLILVGENKAIHLIMNQRQGVFSDETDGSGLSALTSATAVAAGDFNNDGALDLAVAENDGTEVKLYSNLGKGLFSEKEKALGTFNQKRPTHIKDLEFLDFDNDGKLDLLMVGEAQAEGNEGIHLFHQGSDVDFEEVTRILPTNLGSAQQISLLDYNEDGDTDIVLSGSEGAVYLLRNDGGNRNHYLNMKLVGLRTGSAKNNYFGIGSKVEMRAGDLYQSQVVTKPEISFGLGNRSKADVIRITWTNGVPQNILLPDADQALIEEQTLKGSCPFLYAWNGERYEFVKDITWRSALGMPLGIMGENTRYAFPDASDDYIKINAEQIKPKDGYYSIQITSELWETIYMDRVRMVAVDHPDSVDVFVPEQFSPPPFPGMELHQVSKKIYPISVKNENDLDLLDLVKKKDDRYVSQFKKGKYQGLAEMHELIIDPGQDLNFQALSLYLNGWIFPTDASINTALAQSEMHQLTPPVVQVIGANGDWESVIYDMGFPMGKDKTVIVDLSDKIKSKDKRIRIQTNMEIYWDEIFFATGKVESPVQTTFMNPVSADLHYRGFSKTYRKGGRYGPHWFDYSELSQEKKWRDLTGHYTRYGGVLELLDKADNQYVISNAGDEMSLRFDEKTLPKLKEGWTRDFLIHSVGWVKDGDMNTASGQTVEPLPYHGMKSYPPDSENSGVSSQATGSYHETYNTRLIQEEDVKPGLNKLELNR